MTLENCMKQFIFLTAISLSLFGQTADHRNINQLGFWDASGAKLTKPNRSGSTLPSSCSNVETFQLTTTGALHVCVAGAWKQISTPFAISGSDISYSAGNVGIGGAAIPGYKLAVSGSQYLGNGTFNLFSTSADNSFVSPIIFMKRGSTAGGINAAVTDSAELGHFGWYGFGGTSYKHAATIMARAGGNFTESSSPGVLDFYTTPVGSTSASHAGRIDSNGSWLFGTTSNPNNYRAVINGTIGATAFVGPLTGNAQTATAMAANGTNCSAGQVPLGVDASGAAEGCYDPNTYRSGQINFVYGGSASTNIDATTVNNVWRSHAHQATITEVACWTDAGTVTLSVKDSAGNQVTTSTLGCAAGGAATTSINSTYALIGTGEGLGFTTSSVSGVKNLSVSIKYTRSY